MIFRRRGRRFAELIERQLDLFEREHADVVAEARERLRLYNEAERDEAEELYGDYVDSVETGTELLADLRDHFARTLDEDAADAYEREFNAAVGRRLRPFALEIDNR